MRREHLFRMPHDEAVSLIARAPVAHLASTDDDGAPVLRAVHPVVVDGWALFHAAPAGEKTRCLGRPAVLSVEEVVAEVPSYFTDPERACPATTLYRSAQAHGPLTEVEDPALKAAALQALMEKYQPEGGYAPITAEHPLYAKPVAGLLVAGVALDRVDGKSKLAQNRSPADLARTVEGLWKRGRRGDPAAIEAVLAANPQAVTPAFLRGPGGTRLVCAPTEEDSVAAARLLDGAYWLPDLDRARLSRALLGSAAWVVARDGDLVVATARAISDGAQRARVFDVTVAPSHRGVGLGRALVSLLLDHPAVRDVALVTLGTRDARGLYEALGFEARETVARAGCAVTEMALVRGAKGDVGVAKGGSEVGGAQ